MISSRVSALIIGLALCSGLLGLGLIVGNSAVRIKQMERSVTVKGLAEKEFPADIVIWPIQFTAADNNLQKLYENIAVSAQKIEQFLIANQIDGNEITVNPPAITDKSAQSYGGSQPAQFRYSALQTVTVYSQKIDQVRLAMSKLSKLGRDGIVFNSDNYDARPEYLFTRLNEIKPQMIEEATRKARAVALKFAADSQSKLGRIKRASQGQFSISDRDRSTPFIKRIRVVSTIEYYLSD